MKSVISNRARVQEIKLDIIKIDYFARRSRSNNTKVACDVLIDMLEYAILRLRGDA